MAGPPVSLGAPATLPQPPAPSQPALPIPSAPAAQAPPAVANAATTPPPAGAPAAAVLSDPRTGTPAGGASSTPASTPASSHANTATLVMGPTGSGKSSLIATLADYIWAKYQRVLLLASCDGGGIPMEIQKRIHQGKIRYWRMYTRDPGNEKNLAWDTMLKACLGWWPMEINPLTGECPIAVPLMPPVATLYTMLCPNGHVIKQVRKNRDLTPELCRSCGMLTNDMNMRVERTSRAPKFFEDVGAIAIEGLTSMCAWGEEDLGNRAARGDLEGMKGAIGGAVVSGDFTLGQVTMSHVGFIQQQVRTLVLNSQSIPGLVVPPIFTALTLDATVEGTRVCGPQLSGRAKTDVAPAWFGNCLETEKREPAAGRAQFRLWLSQWRDPAGVVHLCKNRASPGVLPQYLEDVPLTGTNSDEVTAFQHFSLGKFFEMLDAGLTRALGTSESVAVNRMVKYEDPFEDLKSSVVLPPHANTGLVAQPVQAGPPGIASLPQAPAAPSVPSGSVGISPSIPNATLPLAGPPIAGNVTAASAGNSTVQPIPTTAAPPAMTIAPPPTVAPPPGRRPMAAPAAAPIAPPTTTT